MNHPKYALITRPAATLGAAIARAVHQQGYQTVLLDLQEQAVQATAATLPGAQAFACDVTDATRPWSAFLEQIGAALRAVGQQCGRRQVLRCSSWSRPTSGACSTST